MTKLIRLTSGTDVADLRGEPEFDGSKTTKGPNGQEIPRFRFVALQGRGRPVDLRGWAHEVTNEEFDALMTQPGMLFEEVTPEQADKDRLRHTAPQGSEIGRQIFGAEAYLPPPPPTVAQSLPRTAEEITQEVKREIAAADATNTTEGGGEAASQTTGRKGSKA